MSYRTNFYNSITEIWDMIEFLPNLVRVQLGENFGTPTRIEPLRGLTKANVWRVHFASETVIIKQTKQKNEAFFYKYVGPKFKIGGIPIPNLYLSHRELDSVWLIIEDIPNSFPRESWSADVGQLNYLRQIHNSDGEMWRTEPTLFRPQWTNEMTEAALTWFPPALVGEQWMRKI